MPTGLLNQPGPSHCGTLRRLFSNPGILRPARRGVAVRGRRLALITPPPAPEPTPPHPPPPLTLAQTTPLAERQATELHLPPVLAISIGFLNLHGLPSSVRSRPEACRSRYCVLHGRRLRLTTGSLPVGPARRSCQGRRVQQAVPGRRGLWRPAAPSGSPCSPAGHAPANSGGWRRRRPCSAADSGPTPLPADQGVTSPPDGLQRPARDGAEGGGRKKQQKHRSRV